MRKKQNQRSQKQDDVRQAEAVKPQVDTNPQFEQLANDQRELERMLESIPVIRSI